jgi:glutamyl-tRNA reductase
VSQSASPYFSIILVGLSHHSAPVELRERFALTAGNLEASLLDLRNGLLSECAIVSTCNRLEVYALAKDHKQGWQAIEYYLIVLCGLSPDVLRPYLYRMSGADTIEHLMRVACGLESMMLGETQILGQVNEALAQAQAAGTASGVLSHLFTHAIHTSKRAHTETAISYHTTSISHAAAKLVQHERGSLTNLNILILGAGEMAALAARAVQIRGAQQITLISRAFDRSEAVAQSIGANAASWAQLTDMLVRADVIISATGASQPVLHRRDVESVLAIRSGRPLLVIDIAVPRDVDPMVGLLPHVRCFNIDDLQAILDENQAERQAAVPKVEIIIQQEQRSFLDWLHSREVVPVISELYRHALSIVDSEIERTLNKLDGLTPHEQKVISQFGYRIANKLLHEPTVRLKAAATEGSGMSYAHLIREMFALEEAHNPDINLPQGDQTLMDIQGMRSGD